MEHLTIRQAYDAMRLFLEDYNQIIKSDVLGDLLEYLDLAWLDPSTGERWPADPAMWDQWMACVQEILFPDTTEHRQMLEDLVSDKANYLGTDVWKSEWYAKILENGQQLWAMVRDNTIQYGGIREKPKFFNSEGGLSSPNDP